MAKKKGVCQVCHTKLTTQKIVGPTQTGIVSVFVCEDCRQDTLYTKNAIAAAITKKDDQIEKLQGEMEVLKLELADRHVSEFPPCEIVVWDAGKKKLCGKPSVAYRNQYHVCEQHNITPAMIAKAEQEITQVEESYHGPEEKRYRMLQK